MSDAEKQPFITKAEEAKELVERQKVELKKKGYYTLENGTKSTDPENSHLLKVKKSKSEAAKKKSIVEDDEEEEEEKFVHPPPKRAASAWIYFNTDFVKKFVQDGGDRKNAFTESSKKWNQMTEEDKQPFVDKESAAKVLVEKQKKELAKKGYYTLEDGTKSTDEANAHLLKVKKPIQRGETNKSNVSVSSVRKSNVGKKEEKKRTRTPAAKKSGAKKSEVAATPKKSRPASARKQSVPTSVVWDGSMKATEQLMAMLDARGGPKKW